MCMFCRSLFVFLYFFIFGHCVVSLFRFTDSDYSFGIFKSSYIFILFLSFDMYGMWYQIHFARIINVLKFINWQIIHQAVLKWLIGEAVIFVKGLFLFLYWRVLNIVVFMNIPLKIDLLKRQEMTKSTISVLVTNNITEKIFQWSPLFHYLGNIYLNNWAITVTEQIWM